MKLTPGFCRRSLWFGAALFVLAALALAACAIPLVRADAFAKAAPAADLSVFRSNVIFNLPAAVALIVIGFRIERRNRLSMIVLWMVIVFSLVFAFGLNETASGFRKHGPAMRNAILLLRCCAVADSIAALLVVASIAFGPKPDLPKLSRLGTVASAFCLGLVGVFVLFFLGETLGDYAMFIGVGVYCLITQWRLSRGNPRALRQDWVLVLVLNLPLLASALIPLANNPHHSGARQVLWVAILAVACSFCGVFLAARTRPRALAP